MAYTYVLTDFRTRFPEIADVGDDYINAFINEANLLLMQHKWKDLWTTGVGYYVAHHACLIRRQITGDDTPVLPIRAQHAGTVSVTYDAIKEGTTTQNFFGGTSYGQQFLRLYSKLGIGALVTTGR